MGFRVHEQGERQDKPFPKSHHKISEPWSPASHRASSLVESLSLPGLEKTVARNCSIETVDFTKFEFCLMTDHRSFL
jgi:hypothetical protein